MLHPIVKLIYEGLYSDITIIVNNKKYKVHKHILKMKSNFFKNLFSEKYKDDELIKKNKNKILFEEFKNNEAFEIILKIIYDIPVYSLEHDLYLIVIEYLNFLLINIPKSLSVHINTKDKFIMTDSYEYIYLNGKVIMEQKDFPYCIMTSYIESKNIIDVSEIKEYMKFYGIDINCDPKFKFVHTYDDGYSNGTHGKIIFEDKEYTFGIGYTKNKDDILKNGTDITRHINNYICLKIMEKSKI